MHYLLAVSDIILRVLETSLESPLTLQNLLGTGIDWLTVEFELSRISVVEAALRIYRIPRYELICIIGKWKIEDHLGILKISNNFSLRDCDPYHEEADVFRRYTYLLSSFLTNKAAFWIVTTTFSIITTTFFFQNSGKAPWIPSAISRVDCRWSGWKHGGRTRKNHSTQVSFYHYLYCYGYWIEYLNILWANLDYHFRLHFIDELRSLHVMIIVERENSSLNNFLEISLIFCDN